MKKIFHLSIVSLITISVMSCSKSSNDLVTNEKANLAKSTEPATPASQNIAGLLPGQQTGYIYPQTLQPHSLVLGKGKESVLHNGNYNYVVFFVKTDIENIQSATSARMKLVDPKNGADIISSNLISFEQANIYGVVEPDDLKGKPYMFAIVGLDKLKNHTNKMINLAANISGGFTIRPINLTMDRAFVYIP